MERFVEIKQWFKFYICVINIKPLKRLPTITIFEMAWCRKFLERAQI